MQFERVAEKYFICIAALVKVEVEYLFPEPLRRIAAAEGDAPFLAAHADVTASGEEGVKALKRRRAGRFEQHVHGGLGPDAVNGRAFHMRKAGHVLRRQQRQQPRAFLRVLVAAIRPCAARVCPSRGFIAFPRPGMACRW